MLGTIREKIQGIFATVIIALIVIPFALWGVNQYFQGDSKVVVAKVDGTTISHDALQRELERYRNRVNPKLLDLPFFKQQVLNQMIQRVLVRKAVDKAGFGVSREQLGALIRAMPEFQTGGSFDAKRYQELLRRSGQTYETFEASMQQQKMLDQFISGIKESGFVTSQDQDQVLALAQQRRRIAVATVDVAKLERGIHPGAKDVQSYYDGNKQQFEDPEQVRVAYIQMSAKGVSQAYKPTDAELRAAYSDEGSRFATPPVRRVSHILIPLAKDASPAQVQKALKEAQELSEKAKAGADFAALARKYSGDKTTASHGGDLGRVTPGLLPQPLADAIATLKQGGVTGPVRTKYGYHVAKVTEYKPGHAKSFAQVRPQLVQLVKQEKGTQKYYDMVDKFNDLVYEQSDSLEPAAKALGLKIEKSGWFARSGGTGIAGKPKVAAAAFSDDVLNNKRNSDSIEIGQDSVLALRVIGHRAARLKPLAEVRTQIVQALKKQQAQQEAAQLSDRILARARKTGSLAQAVRGVAGVVYRAPELVGRNKGAGVGQTELQAAFFAARPKSGHPSFTSASLGDKGQAVIEVLAVIDGKAKDLDDKDRKELLAAMKQRHGEDYFQDFVSGLRKQAKIKINQKAM
jgi:peptidyl-prolyl cis-trans isomerase D